MKIPEGLRVHVESVKPALDPPPPPLEGLGAWGGGFMIEGVPGTRTYVE